MKEKEEIGMERKLKITVTDEEGVVLDSCELFVSKNTTKIAVKPMTKNDQDYWCEETLTIEEGV